MIGISVAALRLQQQVEAVWVGNIDVFQQRGGLKILHIYPVPYFIPHLTLLRVFPARSLSHSHTDTHTLTEGP